MSILDRTPIIGEPVREFPTEAEFFTLENGIYPDEPPVNDGDGFHPEPEDLDWWYAHLRHLESQLDDCRHMPKTRWAVRSQIADAHNHLGLIHAALAESIAETSLTGHDA